MYTVINNDYVGFNGNTFTRRVDLVCDTSADLPTAEQIADRIFCWLLGMDRK